MGLTAIDHNLLLSKLTVPHTGEEVVKLLGDVACNPQAARRFVETLVAGQAPQGDTNNSVHDAMHVLEAAAEISELSARMLMSHLWIIANSCRMHDVCDSIDLWLSSNKSPDLSRYLMLVAEAEENAGIRIHLEQLA